MQLNFSCPDEIVLQLDKYVDKIRYRNRAQLMTAIFAEWLNSRFVADLNPAKKQENKNSDKKTLS